jgi:hypothetical protein
MNRLTLGAFGVAVLLSVSGCQCNGMVNPDGGGTGGGDEDGGGTGGGGTGGGSGALPDGGTCVGAGAACNPNVPCCSVAAPEARAAPARTAA